jgi:hypothetical protein
MAVGESWSHQILIYSRQSNIEHIMILLIPKRNAHGAKNKRHVKIIAVMLAYAFKKQPYQHKKTCAIAFLVIN